MIRPAAIITALGVLLFAATSANSADLAPDWRLQSADGEIVRLSEEVKEQPAILFFWATWCPYCKALMPHLQSVRLEYGDQVKILAINFREDGDPVAFIKNAGDSETTPKTASDSSCWHLVISACPPKMTTSPTSTGMSVSYRSAKSAYIAVVDVACTMLALMSTSVGASSSVSVFADLNAVQAPPAFP